MKLTKTFDVALQNYRTILEKASNKVNNHNFHYDELSDDEATALDLCAATGQCVADSTTCCGVVELTEIADFNKEELAYIIKNEVVDSGGDKGKLIIYYGVNKEIIDILKSFGFKQFAKFKNPNSKNVVMAVGFIEG